MTLIECLQKFKGDEIIHLYSSVSPCDFITAKPQNVILKDNFILRIWGNKIVKRIFDNESYKVIVFA